MKDTDKLLSASKYYALNVHGAVEVNIHLFILSALNIWEVIFVWLRHFTPEKPSPATMERTHVIELYMSSL